MNIRIAAAADLDWIGRHDRHVSREELQSLINAGRVLLAETDGIRVGWLRWNLFWDNTPFMNMLYFLEDYRRRGYGKATVAYWEELMLGQGYRLVMTSTQSNEQAQHFYRKLGYRDAGALLLEGEALEIIFDKKLEG